MKEQIKKVTRKLPRNREDWTFLFQLVGFIGNLMFGVFVLLGMYGKSKSTPPASPAPVQIIVVDSTYLKEHTPIIFDSEATKQ